MSAAEPRELRDGLGVHPLVAVAFDALDGASVRWCVLHGETRLDAPPGDVDVLVHPDDATAAWRCLLYTSDAADE